MNAELSDELEALGDTCSEDGAPSAFARLREGLKHPSCVVREVAVYGAARLGQRFKSWAPDVVRALSEVSTHDTSPGVREAATEVLEDL